MNFVERITVGGPIEEQHQLFELELPCGRVKGILETLLVSGNWFAGQTDL
jgi:hypothetical protein